MSFSRAETSCAFALMIAGLAGIGGCERPPTPTEIAAIEADLPEQISYNWHVRPILSNNCFRCHGNDAAMRKAGLRLDVKENAFAPIPEDKAKRAVVPGKPWKSEAIVRILSEDQDTRMPPLDSHKTLTTQEKAILYKWVEQGAAYEQHWAYIPPGVTRPEQSPFAEQAVNEVDKYVYAGLHKKRLSPSPEADRETLINRVTLDLTGLPPTLRQVDDFVADKDPSAYEKLVDRLLRSQDYAERMTTYWLDVARYGESDGYLDDNYGRLIYPWRDWVISAFDHNMPYDKFASWQLAGDLLPSPTREQILATAFARVGKRSTEAGIIDEEYRVEYRNERSELVGKAFLGLTLGCAKCHDHKYDAISHADYYSMAGFFNSIDERGYYSQPDEPRATGPTLPWPEPNQKTAWDLAKADLATKVASYDSARQAAGKAATARADAIMKGAPQQIGKAMLADIEDSTLVYYPLDEGHKGPLEPIMIMSSGGMNGGGGDRGSKGATNPVMEIPGVPLDMPPGESVIGRPAVATQITSSGVRPETRGRVVPTGAQTRTSDNARLTAVLARTSSDSNAVSGALQRSKRRFSPAPGQAGGVKTVQPAGPPPPRVLTLPDTLTAENVSFSKSGRPGDPDVTLQKASFIPGAKGQGFLIDDNMGFLGPRNVGRFERTDPFSIDLYIKPRVGKPYTGAGIVFFQDQRAGWSVLSEGDRVRFDIVHSAPFNQISVLTQAKVPQGQWTHVTVSYDGSSKASGVKLFLDGKPAAVDVISDHLTRSALPYGRYGLVILGGGYWNLTFGKKWRAEEFTGGGLDELRVVNRALTAGEAAVLHDPSLAEKDMRVAHASFVEREIAKDPLVIAAATELRKARERENEVSSKIREVMVLADQTRTRPTYVLQGGLYDKPLDEVQPQGLQSVFAWKSSLQRNRKGLTEWLFDDKNPLTARVFVNRLWQMHFGTGLVETVEDFGTQGAIPSNPELLDWLAVEFVKSGWDIKHMHKLMVMSATYRQSSFATPELLEADPRNFLLARGPRYRLQAEMIRDNALFASGLLVDKKGGDAVFPYQPDGVWSAGAGVNVYPGVVPDDDRHRRSMYTFYKRASPYPSLAVFDMADRSVSTVARRMSNTPLQALVLLNDIQYMEAYRKIAERAIGAAPEADKQVEMVFRLATRRRPVEAEMNALRDYYGSETKRFAGKSGSADKLLQHGVAPINPGIDRTQLAALTMVAAVVMNSPDAYMLR
ncbi:MAG: DUF1553 domain-containing protein [Pseudomonadota bacterium]